MKCFDLLLTVVCMFLKPRLQWIHSDSSTVGKLMLIVFLMLDMFRRETVAQLLQSYSESHGPSDEIPLTLTSFPRLAGQSLC